MRPRDLADAISSAVASTTFTLPVSEARKKARDIINRAAKDGIIPVVENWHQVADDQIEFTVRNLNEPD